MTSAPITSPSNRMASPFSVLPRGECDPWTVHSRCSSHRASLDGGRTDLAEGRVPAPLLIEHLDVIEQLHLGLAAAVKAIPQLALHGGRNSPSPYCPHNCPAD